MLEKHCISLEVDNQLKKEFFQRNNSSSEQSAPTFDQLFELNDLKAQSQEKDTVIVKLKERLKSLSGNAQDRKIKRELEEIETINIELDNRVTKLVAKNEHLKQTYKQLYDSIKSSRIRSKEQCDDLIKQVNLKSAEVSDLNASLQEKVLVIIALKETLSKLKGKTIVNEIVPLHSVDPELFKIDVVSLAPKLRNNMTAHTDYLRHTQEETATLREIVESERLVNPLNTSLDYAYYACKYTKRIQELLIILQQTCPCIPDLGTKLMAVTPKNNNNKIRLTKHIPLSGNTPAITTFLTNVVSNTPVLSSTGVNLLSSVSGSQPQGNTKNDRIQRAPSKAKKNKLEDHHRIVRHSLNKKKSVVDTKAISSVTNSKLNVNANLECATCNGCLFSDNHDLCVLACINSVNASLKSKSVLKPYLDSGCSKHMTEDRSQLINFVQKFLGTVKFGNDHVAKIMGYGDYKIGNVTISRVYFVEGLGHNLFSVGQFYDSDLEVTFCQHTCFIRNLDGVDLLTDDSSAAKVSVRRIQTDNGTEFVNQTLREYYEEVGISHETSVARSPQQNGVVERRNRTLIEVARTIVDHQAPKVIAPIDDVIPPVQDDSTGSPSLTTVDQDVPSVSKSHTTAETQSSVIPQDVKEDNLDIEVAHIGNDLLLSVPILEVTSTQSSSTVSPHQIVQPDHPIPQHTSKWIKDHPLNNIIGQLFRSVSTRLQLHEHALFCYYDAFLSLVEPKTYKDALTQSCWIEAILEAIWIFLAYAAHKTIPDGFVDQDNPNHVYKLKKALYGLNQAPHAWYDMLSLLLISQDFSKGLVDPTLFIHKNGNDLLLVQMYIDDIIFASSTPELCDLFANLMCSKFKMSMMSKISFFLGLQNSQSPRGIFINQSKYALESLKKYGFESCDLVDTPMVEKSKLDEDKEGKAVDPSHYCEPFIGVRYPKDSSVALTAFADADHAGCQDNHRSTSGSVQFLGERLISWSSKWQKSAAISNYGLGFNKIPMYCDNKSVIALCCNNVQHSRSKNINIRYHFIKEQDDHMFSTIKLVSKHQNTQQFGALLPIELTNDEIRNSKAYKEYYAIAIGEAAPKPKASVRRTRSSSDTSITPPTAAASPRLTAFTKGKQTAKASKAKSLSALSEVAMTEAQQLKLVTKRSMQQTHIPQPSGSEKDDDGDEEDEGDDGEEGNGDDDEDDDGDEGEEGDDDDIDQEVVRDYDKDDEEEDDGNGEEDLGLNIGEEERHIEEEDRLYKDVNINQGRGLQASLEVEDSHMTLTPVNPDGQQQSSSVSSQFVTSMLNLTLDVGMESIFETTSQLDVPTPTSVAPFPITAPTNDSFYHCHYHNTKPSTNSSNNSSEQYHSNLPNFGSLFRFNDRLRSLETNFFEAMQTNQFADAVSAVPGIVQRYIDKRMNEAVKVAVQIQSDRLREEAQRENDEFLIIVDENMKNIIKEQVKEQVMVQVSKILPRIEQAVNEQLKAKDDEPSTGPDRGSKRHIEGKEPESASAPMKTATRSVGRSTQRSRSRQASVNKSALAKEPMQTTSQMEELSHPEFDIGADDQPVVQSSQHLEWFSQQHKPPSPDCDWNKTVPAIEDLVPRTIWIEEPIGYDKHALWGVSHWGRKRQQFYGFAVNQESARDVYSKRRIITITKLKIVEWHSYKHLDWITVRRDDDKLYKFQEGDFKRLSFQDLEDILLLLVQGKLTNLTVEERFAFNVSLRMFTRSIVIKRRVEDLQLGVESYQKKLNLTKPDSYRSDLKRKEAYTAYSNP
uniref:Integrase catalytic domain-containing protein n=1 Tax=Tanacetum cinerariifolium TaxID=118510 RepID=A0A6L2J9S0_TANCI|nr:hypothetical protein [Tanacetum cinerariifolium]